MKRSLKFMACAAGAVSLLTAGLGCSHHEEGAKTPAQEGTTTPPFESNVGPGQTQAPPSEMGAPTPPPPPRGEPPQPGMGAPQAPPPGVEPGGGPGAGMQPGPGAAGGMSERDLCTALSNSAKLKVNDVPNGAEIVMTPKDNNDLATVRDDARRIEAGIHAGPGGAPAGGEPCGLFTLGRYPGVRVQVTERHNAVGMTVTTTNPAEIKDLRRQVKDQVNNLGK